MIRNIFILLVLCLNQAFALDSAQVLPAKINSPSLRTGTVFHVGQRYDNNGDLLSLDDLKSVEFNVKTLSQIEPQVHELVKALNSFGSPGDNYGDKLNLGVMRVSVSPKIDYTAPIHAWGLTENWTFGFGVPVIHYTNEIQIRQDGSNLAAYRKQFEGRISPELDRAFDRLSLDIPAAVHSELEAKGYRPLDKRDQTFIGDIQLVSLYKMPEKGRASFIHRGTMSLPTGPKDNPDDLMDLNVFGETSVTNELLAAYKLGGRLDLGGRAGIKIMIPDKLEKRVPKDENDLLPDASQKEVVTRYGGETAILGTSANYHLNASWMTGVGYEYLHKQRDRYKGNRNLAYSVLENETDSISHKSRVDLSYSTVQAYFDKKAIIPTIFTLEISDIFAGRNIARQTFTEFNWMLFY